MYAVVLFTTSNEVEVVSLSWLTETDAGTVCHWPPYTKPSTMMRAVRIHEPKADSWQLFPVRCLYKSGELAEENYLILTTALLLLVESKCLTLNCLKVYYMYCAFVWLTTDDLDKASRKRRQAEDTSDLQTEVSDVEKKKRR